MNRRGRSTTGWAAGIAAEAAALCCVAAVALCARPASATELAILRNGFSIRHEHRQVMGATTRLFLGAGDSSFTDVPTAEIVAYEPDTSSSLPPPAPATPPGAALATSAPSHPEPAKPALPLNQVVNSASASYHLDPDLVNSVIHAESGFNARAVSPKGARGLMQLMPDTASRLGVNDAFDAQSNVAGGSRYLRELLERYNFDLVKALAAYNAGPERVEQYQGVPPFRETRAYVARIVHDYNRKKIAQEKEAKQKQKGASTRGAGKAPSPVHRASKTPATAVTAESAR